MLRLFLALIAIGFVLLGCGQSGPLYLPGNPSEIKSAPPAEEPSGQEDDDEQG